MGLVASGRGCAARPVNRMLGSIQNIGGIKNGGTGSMKSKLLTLALLGICIGTLYAVYASTAKSAKLVPFEIQVTKTSNGVEFRCESGCAWKHLSFSCKGDAPCSSVVNELGNVPRANAK